MAREGEGGGHKDSGIKILGIAVGHAGNKVTDLPFVIAGLLLSIQFLFKKSLVLVLKCVGVPHEIFKETKRLSISPRIHNGEGQLFLLMHVRTKNEPSILSSGWSSSGNELTIDYKLKEKSVFIVWNLEKREFKLVRP